MSVIDKGVDDESINISIIIIIDTDALVDKLDEIYPAPTHL